MNYGHTHAREALERMTHERNPVTATNIMSNVANSVYHHRQLKKPGQKILLSSTTDMFQLKLLKGGLCSLSTVLHIPYRIPI